MIGVERSTLFISRLALHLLALSVKNDTKHQAESKTGWFGLVRVFKFFCHGMRALPEDRDSEEKWESVATLWSPL